MDTVRSLCLLFLVAQPALSCNTVLWIPKLGETIGEATNVLGIGLEDFKKYNDGILNLDAIYTTETFAIPYKSPLPSGSWLANHGTCFLQLRMACEETHSSTQHPSIGKTMSPDPATTPSSSRMDQTSSVLTRTGGSPIAQMSSTTLDEDTTSSQSSTAGKFATGTSTVPTPKISISSEWC